jgi:nucleoside-diphosphate-sugar epimerase
MVKKVLVTGASGFIGRQCIPRLLEKGYKVHALSLHPIEEYRKDVAWHCHDFLDDEKTKNVIDAVRPSHCLHLAWYTQPEKYWSSLENIHWTASSISLISHFHKQGGERFVGAGTCAEYDWRYGHCTEELTPVKPASLYGTCKNALQEILSSFTNTNLMSTGWGRFFFLYGPYEHRSRLVPSVINSLLRNEQALCSAGNQIRDFMHVSDAANAFVMFLESDIVGPVNIASGYPVSIKDAVIKIAEQFNAYDKIRLGALPTRNESPILTADVNKLQKEVGHKSVFDLDSGIKATVDWWKTHNLEIKP